MLGSFSGSFKFGRRKVGVLDIVRTNLQLYLNAADSTSYSGSGTTWTDLSPNGYATTLQGSPTFNSTHFTFDFTDYIDTNQSLASEDFSVGAWFRTSSAGIKMIISKETNGGWPWNYRIWLNGGQIIGDIATSGGSSNSIASSLTNYNNGSWYYVMFTRDSSKLRLYVNGSEVNNTNATLSSITNSQEVWFGLSAYLGGSYQWNGDLSRMFVYNRTLTASEILQNYNATKATYGL